MFLSINEPNFPSPHPQAHGTSRNIVKNVEFKVLKCKRTESSTGWYSDVTSSKQDAD